MTADLTMPGTETTRVLVACFAKSGSTYVANILANYLGIPKREALSYWGYREQNLDPSAFDGRLGPSFVLQMHIKPYGVHLDLLRASRVRTVWLRRNVGDALVSLDDHIARESHQNPIGYIHDRDRYLAMEPQRRYRYLVRHALPWYVSFHLMWRSVTPEFGAVPARYEDLADEPVCFFLQLLGDLGEEAQADRLHAAMTGSLPDTRFNRGLNGRSSGLFSAETKSFLEEALRDHPEDLGDLLEELPWRAMSRTPRSGLRAFRGVMTRIL